MELFGALVDIGVVSADHAAEEEEDLDWADDGVHDEAAAVVADHPLLDAPQQLAQRVVGVLLRECLPPEGVTLSATNSPCYVQINIQIFCENSYLMYGYLIF